MLIDEGTIRLALRRARLWNDRPLRYVDYTERAISASHECAMTRTVSMICVLLMALPLMAKSKPVSVPFTTNSDGMVIVPATLGGTIPMHVILDTGAGLDVIAPSLIEKVHGRPAGQFTGFRMWGERLDLALFVVPAISVGPIVKKDALVGTWDVLDQLHLDGIVAVNDLRQQPFTLDFANQQLVFETEKTLGKRKAHGSMSRLQMDDQRGVTLDLFSQFTFGKQTGQCEIDTGSPEATISTRYMSELGIDKDAKDVRKQERKTIAGAAIVNYWTTVPQIALASAPQVSLAPAPIAFSDIIYDCVIGVDFWHGRAFTIDIPDRQLIVSPTNNR